MPGEIKPNVEGSFRKTPLANVLLYAREKHMTGSVVVHPRPQAVASSRSTLVLENGAIVALSLPDTDDPREALSSLFGYPDGAYGYYNQHDLLEGEGRLPAPEDVFPIVWQGLYAFPPDDDAINAVLDRIGPHSIALRTGHEIHRFQFGADVAVVVDLLRAMPVPVEQILDLDLDPVAVRTMLYLLALARQLEIVAAPAPAATPLLSPRPPIASPMPLRPPPVPASPPPARPPPVPPPVPRAGPPPVPTSPSPARPPPPPPPPRVAPAPVDPRLVEEARHKLAAMENQTYFEMLGVPMTATDEEVQAAFTEQAKTWHPDRATAPELRELHTGIFENLNAAQSTLTDAKARPSYEEAARSGGGTPDAQKRVVALLESVQDVQRAEICLKRKDHVEAERLLRKALEANPEDLSAMLLLAQSLFERDQAGTMDETLKLVGESLKIAATNDRAHCLMGKLLKARGDARATQYFRKALELNPHNVEAEREVRLAGMRTAQKQAKPAAGGLGGLLSRFLKK